MSYESINEEINLLKEGAGSEEAQALIKIQEQLISLLNSNISGVDVAGMLLSDDDALEDIDQDTGFYEAARNLQHSIINYFK